MESLIFYHNRLYGSNPNCTDEPVLNKCTYFVVIDKLQRAKAVDPSVTERANELISTYSRHTPQAKDLYVGLQSRVTVSFGLS